MRALSSRIASVGMVLSLLSCPLSAEMATRRWGKPPAGPSTAAPKTPRSVLAPTCYVAEARSAPNLDGKLDDEAWKAARPLPLTRTLDGGGTAAQPTEVRLLRDAKTLYVAFRCTEPLLAKLQASTRGHDGAVWDDDSVELFLGAAGIYYHFGVNAVGSTYDGKVKDAGWNSGFKAAVGREQAAWTAELAIPLASMADLPSRGFETRGRVPTEWTANFNRNRHVTGNWEESAWSPTFSGDSHVPDRFGRMLFREPPAEAKEAPAPLPSRGSETRGRVPVAILPAQGGLGVVRFDLADLPQKARILRADLLIHRTAQVDGRMDEALTNIEIYPVFEEFAANGKPAISGDPLELRTPWYDRFDATEAVRAACRVPRDPAARFFVKACPFWNAEATCLDIAYEGKPENVPPQVTGLQAFHHAGQTFLTWKEIDDPVGKDEATWAELKAVLDGLDRTRQVRYCIYRHPKPITARNLPDAERIATVKPLSGWNVDGRNIDRPIDHVIATQEVLFCGHWSPFNSASIDGEYGRDCPIDRFAIRDGEKPLPRGTGLYVHTVSATAGSSSRAPRGDRTVGQADRGTAGKAYYAVVTSVDGVQNTTEFSAANATAEAVSEAPAPAEPVLQGELPRMPFFNFDQKRLHYVQWVAPPLANVPYQYHNWSVGVPSDLGKNIPLELSLHRDGHSYWRTQYRIERDSIVLSPYDFPVKSWWHGYHESLGTLKSFKQGFIQPYTERRLLAFIDWACRTWPVDRRRILVTGCRGGAAGSGALHLGLRHPEVFSLVIAGHPMINYAAGSRDTDRQGLPLALSMQVVWGRADWAAKTDDKGFWEQHDLLKVVQALPPTADLSFLSLTSNHGYADCRKLYDSLLARHDGIVAEFSWGGTRYVPVSTTHTSPNVLRLDIRKDRPFLACASRQGLDLVSQGKMGDLNLQFRWRDTVDEPDRFEATIFLRGQGDKVADVVPRRLQKFSVAHGKSYAWTNGAQSGEATVGDDGLLVLEDVKFAPEGSRLVIRPKR